LPDGLNITGVILTDQLKNLDWQARNLYIRDCAPNDVVDDCVAKIRTYLDFTYNFQ
jgi:mRNA interferase MazF